LAGENKTLPPEPDEVEISLFGPGYGECIAIHPGDGQWLIVDSCIDPQSKAPAALRYFSLIGIDPATDVRLIVATHWHDDHVRGLGQLFSACRSAEFVCSDALGSDEFFEVVYAQGCRIMSSNVSGLDEFRQVFDELKLRAAAAGGRLLPPHFAVADRCLWQRQLSAADVNCFVHSLSPSDASLMASKLEIARLLPKAKAPKRGIWPLGKNHAAVALWLSVGDKAALLGADLEETENPHTGWHTIVQSSTRPQETASVFKVPHHGSQTGHNQNVWMEMLEENPTTILAPYRLGGLTLPRDSDIERICGLTDRAFITSTVASASRVIKRDRAVEKTLKEQGVFPRQVYTSLGHIRLRAKQGEPWMAELFDGAQVLCP